MNKYLLRSVIPGLLCAVGLGFVHAATPELQRNIVDAIADAIVIKQAEVNVAYHFVREVEKRVFEERRRPRELTFRSKVVNVMEDKVTQCKGMLIEGNKVVTPSSCLLGGVWEADYVKLAFSNGKEKFFEKGWSKEGDLVYIDVDEETIQGLIAIPVAYTPGKESLEEHFGKDIWQTLQSFFDSKGVVQKERHFHLGKEKNPNSTLQVGDPIIYDGKLVALVKKDIKSYRNLSEKPLAIMRESHFHS